MPIVITQTEYLEFPAFATYPRIVMATPAWEITDLSALLNPPPVRGESDVIPGLDGRQSYPLEVDEGRFALPMVIYGEADDNGVAHTNAHIGVELNALYLRTNLFLPIPGSVSANGVRPAALHLADGSTLEADVQVGFSLSEPIGPTALSRVLDLTVPAGYFA